MLKAVSIAKQVARIIDSVERNNNNNELYLSREHLQQSFLSGVPGLRNAEVKIFLKMNLLFIANFYNIYCIIFQFLLIFRKAAAGELEDDSGLSQLAKLAEVDVEEVGVGGAAKFFEAKAKELAFSNKFESEIRQEQEERKKQAEEAKARKAAFLAKKAAFGVS